MSEIAKDVFKARCLFTFIPRFLWPAAGNVLSMLVLNNCGILQNAITWERGVGFISATYGFMQIGLPVVLFVIRSINIVGMAKKKEAKLAAAKESKNTVEMSSVDKSKASEDPSKEKKE